MMKKRTILDAVEPLPALRDVSLEDGELYRHWMDRFHNKICDLTFANLYLWRYSMQMRIARWEDFLTILRFDSPTQPHIYAPIGQGDLAGVASALFEFIETKFPDVPLAMERIPEEIAKSLLPAGFKVEEDRNNFDYVYRVSDLAELKGRKYASKRNRIRRCLEANKCSYEVITRDNLCDCLSLGEKWCNIRDCDANPSLAAEFHAIREAFEHFEKLKLFGGAIRIDGRIQAFTMAERLDAETAVIHFEKANTKIEGLYQVINQWFCQNALKDYTWVNREQDLGVEGLRRAKMSYYPDHFVKKFRVLKIS